MSVQVPARAAPATTAPAPSSGPAPARVVVATRIPGTGAEDGLRRVSWPRTLLRLTVEPGIHPWSASWRLRRRGPLAAVALAIGLLLLFALSGCASAPTQSVRNWTPAPRSFSTLRCESVLVSHEVQIPPTGDLADVRVTIEDIPRVLGKLRVLVRRPRFAATLSVQSDGKPELDKVLEVTMPQGQTDLTVVLARPDGAPSDWPRGSCRACRIDVELTGLFGAQEGVEAFFINALKDASAIESAFASQSKEAPSRPSPALQKLADEMSAEARRCGAPIDPFVTSVTSALLSLDSARGRLYSRGVPPLPDAKSVFRSWEHATEVIDGDPLASAAARAMGWPPSLRVRAGARLAKSAMHLELLEQLASLSPDDQATSALWVALAMSPDDAAVARNALALPPIRDLADAEARLAWVDPRSDSVVPIPGLSRPASLRVREWRAARHGKKCIGRLGAVPVRDPDADARAVAQLLGADPQGRLQIARASDVRNARATARGGKALLCEPPAIDPTGLFKGLEDKELGEVAERLGGILRELDPRHEDDSLATAMAAPMSQLFCKLFDAQNIQRRASTVAGYKMFVEGGTHLLDMLPGPLVCDGHLLAARDVRQRLREAYRTALDKHAAAERLCPVRAGKCPEEVAASVRRTFSLSRPQLAAPVPEGSRALELPPPFGFSEEWVSKLDRCAREACESLSRLRSEAPFGQFDGPVCAPRAEGEEAPQEVAIRRPEAPSTVTLSSCDAHGGVRLTLHRFPDAGTLVAIASSHQFRYGSETVQRQGRHPQLGRIYERVADLSDPADVSQRSSDVFEVALTPTVENQVFYFFSLRRRDY
jgi:hypothetical protein